MTAEKSFWKDTNLLIVFGVTLMAVLGVASVTPAFPTIQRELGITPNQVGLLITFFTLPGALLTPIIGVMADRYGRKKILIPSLFLFAIAGTACTFINDFDLLLWMRAIQGIGAAALGSINSTIIGDLYEGKRRVQAMGLNASVLSIGVASYPAIGGAMALIGWNYPFLLSALALPIGILALTLLKNPEPRSSQTIKEYLTGTWSHLRNMKIAGLFSAGMLSFIIMYGAYLTYFTILMGEKFNASSLTIGIIMSVASLSNAAMASQLGRIHRWLSLTTILKISFSVYALSMFLVPFISNLWFLLIPAIFSGIANGAALPSIQTSVAEIAPLEYRGAIMSLNNMMLRLGQTLGPPVIGIAYVYGGINATFFTAAGISILVPIVAFIYGITRKS
ncbi:MAG: MFS transporter [Dehalococcoidales bacterium]|nr:MAG: MFS transporter [Dehalococcoidales bacterium]